MHQVSLQLGRSYDLFQVHNAKVAVRIGEEFNFR